jgi:hypothetical protein
MDKAYQPVILMLRPRAATMVHHGSGNSNDGREETMGDQRVEQAMVKDRQAYTTKSDS